MAKKMVRGVVALLLVLVFLVGGLFGSLTVLEYQPLEQEKAERKGTAALQLEEGAAFSLLSWNIGYGGLSETADFFMDGGDGVRTQNRESVLNNLKAFSDYIGNGSGQPEIVLLQECDRKSTRSFGIDEMDYLLQARGDCEASYAPNFRTLFVPFPVPPIGKVESGLVTLSAFASSNAVRISLPCPFAWPIRTVNLKRCLLVNRIPVGDGGKELVLINLHLEAYDDGEGKVAQTMQLAELMEAEYQKGNYVLAAGDFNQSFDCIDTSMYPLQGGDLWECGELETSWFSDNFRFWMDTAAPTCRSLDRPLDLSDPSFQYYCIDGLITSRNLEVESVETVDLSFANSDHNPVLARIRLAGADGNGE